MTPLIDKRLLNLNMKQRFFFEKNQERELDLLFLEGGEVFDMTRDIIPIEKQNKTLYQKIISISKDIDDILDQKPDNIFDFKDSQWLQELKKDTNALSVYWTYVTYFSFNKS